MDYFSNRIVDYFSDAIYTLTFNASGQLTSLAFHVPALNKSQQQTQVAGFSFTVTGLEAGTTYDLTITAKDNNGTTLDEKTMSFTTPNTATPIDQITNDKSSNRKSSNRKFIQGGHLYILHDGKIYTVQGQEVR